MKIEPIVFFPETSVSSYHYSLRNDPEERSFKTGRESKHLLLVPTVENLAFCSIWVVLTLHTSSAFSEPVYPTEAGRNPSESSESGTFFSSFLSYAIWLTLYLNSVGREHSDPLEVCRRRIKNKLDRRELWKIYRIEKAMGLYKNRELTWDNDKTGDDKEKS